MATVVAHLEVDIADLQYRQRQFTEYFPVKVDECHTDRDVLVGPKVIGLVANLLIIRADKQFNLTFTDALGQASDIRVDRMIVLIGGLSNVTINPDTGIPLNTYIVWS